MTTQDRWAFCNRCFSETLHDVYQLQGSNELLCDSDGFPVEKYITEYSALQCKGCKKVMIEVATRFDGTDMYNYEYYPPKLSRRLPDWLKRLPKKQSYENIKKLFEEIYQALHVKASRLSIMGARTLVDIFMNDKLGDIGSFEKKLDTLESKGYLSKTNKKVLIAALDVGHAVSHRGHNPSEEEVFTVIDIVENMLHTIVLDREAAKLKKNTPKRKLIKSN